MARAFEIRSGRRPIGLTEAATPYEALRDYVRSLGCSRDEITALGRDSVYWRGAIYNAVPTEGLKSVDCVDSVVAVRQALEDFQTSISAGDPPADEQWLDWRPLYELARHEP